MPPPSRTRVGCIDWADGASSDITGATSARASPRDLPLGLSIAWRSPQRERVPSYEVTTTLPSGGIQKLFDGHAANVGG